MNVDSVVCICGSWNADFQEKRVFFAKLTKRVEGVYYQSMLSVLKIKLTCCFVFLFFWKKKCTQIKSSQISNSEDKGVIWKKPLLEGMIWLIPITGNILGKFHTKLQKSLFRWCFWWKAKACLRGFTKILFKHAYTKIPECYPLLTRSLWSFLLLIVYLPGKTVTAEI